MGFRGADRLNVKMLIIRGFSMLLQCVSVVGEQGRVLISGSLDLLSVYISKDLIKNMTFILNVLVLNPTSRALQPEHDLLLW